MVAVYEYLYTLIYFCEYVLNLSFLGPDLNYGNKIMSIFYEEDTALQVKAGESFTTGERTNLAENASKAFKAFRKSEIFTSERNNQEEEYINVVDILTSAGHADIVSPLELEFDPLGSGNIDPSEIKTREQLAQEFWEKVSLLQTTDLNTSIARTSNERL